MNSKIAIFTIHYGKREPFNPNSMALASECDRFVFSDQDPQSDSIEYVHLGRMGLDPKRAAGRVKTNPYPYLGQYDWVICVDNKSRIKKPPGEIIEYCRSLGSFGFYTFRHGGRQCIYQEAQECIRRGLDDPNRIKRQMRFYREEKYPENNGLVQTTMIVRNMKDEGWRKASPFWHEQTCLYSKRDQLSLNYIAWKAGLEIGYFEGNIDQSGLLEWPVRFADEQFEQSFTFIPPELRKKVKRVAGKSGLLGVIRGIKHSRR